MPTSTLPPLTPRPYSVTSIRQYLSDGQRLYNLGQFDAAILEFDQIKLASRGLGDVYKRQNKASIVHKT